MNEPSHSPLGGFEQRLLRELRQVVIASPWVSPELKRPAATRRFPRVRLPLALAGAAAAAIAIAIALAGGLPGGGQPTNAWAVDRNPNGTVTVRIDSLSDAAGLERKLNEAGVPALVQYLPPGKTCAGGELQQLQPPPGAVTQSNSDPSGPPPGVTPGEYGLQQGTNDSGGPMTETSGKPLSGNAPGDATTLGISQLSNGGIEFTVDANPDSGQTLVIRNQGSAPGQAPGGQPQGVQLPEGGSAPGASAINVAFVQGKAEPCKVVDSPAQ
jgi:hypothetical protein